MITTSALQHALDLQAQADADRPARLATCCRRGALSAAAAAVGSFFRHGSLTGPERTCCPWPV